MKKKGRSQAKNSFFSRFLFLLISVLVLGLVFFNLGDDMLRHAPMFRIKMIILDPSLQFINKNDLSYLIGRNIFNVDLKDVQRKMGYKYPQISQLKIVKKYPDQLLVQAKRRYALAQTVLRKRIMVVDEQGVVLAFLKDYDPALTVISGLSEKNKKAELGFAVSGQDLVTALNIIKDYQHHKILKSYPLMGIDVSNLSKIELTITNNLKIIIDPEKIEQKMNVLALLLVQAKVDFNTVKYIDLRFNEPVIGQK